MIGDVAELQAKSEELAAASGDAAANGNSKPSTSQGKDALVYLCEPQGEYKTCCVRLMKGIVPDTDCLFICPTILANGPRRGPFLSNSPNALYSPPRLVNSPLGGHVAPG